jgi:hypothetical protein
MQEFLKYMSIFIVVGLVGCYAYDNFLTTNLEE